MRTRMRTRACTCTYMCTHAHACTHLCCSTCFVSFFFYRFLPAAGRTTRRLENFIQVHGLLRAFFFNYLFYFILNIICRVFISIPQASAGLIFVIVFLIFFFTLLFECLVKSVASAGTTWHCCSRS